MTPALAASYLHVFAEAAGHDPAGGGLRRILAFGLFMAAALLFGASYFTAVELGAFKAPLFLGATAWLLLGAAFVAASPFLGGSSLAAALEYVVISAGTAILIAVFWGLLALTALACDYPLPAGLSAAGVAVLCLAGAIVSAAAGSRWAALGGLAAAMLLILAAGGCFGQRGWPYDSANPPPAPRAESPRRRPLQYAAWSSLLSGRWSR